MRFIFAAVGVLPHKRDPLKAFDEKQRRTVSKILERLAGEEGELEKNFSRMIVLLSYLIAGYVDVESINHAIGEVVFDVLDVQRAVIADEGTYLSKKDTIKWMLDDHVIPAVAISVTWRVPQFNLRSLALALPEDPFWFLPDWDDGKCRWPIEKVMRWVYRLADTSVTQFHYPNRDPGEAEISLVNDLENAQGWLAGRYVPSAAALSSTFKKGFAALEERSRADGKPMLSPQQVSGAYLALFLGRVATYVAREICEEFGEDYLRALCVKFKRTWGYTEQEQKGIEWRVQKMMGDQGFMIENMDALWWDATAEQKLSWIQRLGAAESILQQLSKEEKLTEEAIEALAGYYGRLAVLPAANNATDPPLFPTPEGFFEGLMEGDRLRKSRDLAISAIDRYEEMLVDRRIDYLLPWVPSRLRFVYFYRKNEFEAAFEWIAKTYEAAKYRAGGAQYEIVNQYIELAAKTNRRREFNNGIRWAQYLGIEVRFLRKDKPTKENLDFVYSIMRKATYPV